jgi:hypothetical protein
MMPRMAIQIAGVSLPGPTEVLGTARSVADWGVRTVQLAGELPARADALLDSLERLLRRWSSRSPRPAGAAGLLSTFEPLANRAAPLASRFVSELSEQEVAAAVRLVDQLPRLAEHLESDVMPILATLDRVGPDMHELLNVVKDLRTALDGVPGLAYLRRRIRPE